MPDAALELLQAHGYAVRFRNHETVECVLTRDEEAWVAEGGDRKAALDAAVALACPSALSQALFRRALAEQQASTPAPVPAPAIRAQTRTSPKAFPPLVSRDVPAPPDLDRAVEELGVLKERIRSCKAELGLCTPERQRLAILAWICEARTHTEAFPTEARIRDGVAGISRVLTETGKSNWPGSVTALQLQMTPLELPRHLLGGRAPTWARAAQLAELALKRAVQRDDEQALDAYGWADAAHLWPPMRDPTERLLKLQHDMALVGGPLDKHAAPRSGSKPPDPGSYLLWVRQLRWLRGSGVDPERWARLAGRIRWWAGRRESGLQSGAQEFNPSFGPSRAWSEILGQRHEVDADAQERPQLHLPDGVLERARTRTAGKRLAWVGPRRDPSQLQALQQALSEATVEWRLSEASRLPDLRQDIEGGRFDLVLGALGLQSSQPDLVLARACRQGGARYVRAFRGEVVSCMRALDQALSKA